MGVWNTEKKVVDHKLIQPKNGTVACSVVTRLWKNKKPGGK